MEGQQFKGLAAEAQKEAIVYKRQKVFDTIVHKSFQRFHIYYISFTEDILTFSA